MDPDADAAIAHFWSATLHPVEDGNGCVAGAIADLAPARSEGSPPRLFPRARGAATLLFKIDREGCGVAAELPDDATGMLFPGRVTRTFRNEASRTRAYMG
jgi:hypothetical protein